MGEEQETVSDRLSEDFSESCGDEEDSEVDDTLIIDERRNDMVTGAESDKLLDAWMDLRIDYEAVAKQQYKNKGRKEPFDPTQLYKKMRDMNGRVRRSYSIDALYHHVDALVWWKENEVKFPTLALMARIYLSRELASCFQERVFSIAGFTGNKHLVVCGVFPSKKDSSEDIASIHEVFFKLCYKFEIKIATLGTVVMQL